MKRFRVRLPYRLRGLNIFAGDRPESYDELVQRAQRKIYELKHDYRGKRLAFAYEGELIRGKFIDVVEGECPGTFMIVLRIASSRVCSGPCFARLTEGVTGGIVVTGKDGLVGITIKAIAQTRPVAVHLDRSDMARCA